MVTAPQGVGGNLAAANAATEEKAGTVPIVADGLRRICRMTQEIFGH